MDPRSAVAPPRGRGTARRQRSPPPKQETARATNTDQDDRIGVRGEGPKRPGKWLMPAVLIFIAVLAVALFVYFQTSSTVPIEPDPGPQPVDATS